MTHRITVQASYTYAHANDDVLNSTLGSEIQTGEGVNFLAISGLSDSFVGKVSTVTDANTGQSNASSAFINSNGNFVPKAGTFYNGAKIDRGPSDLALNHTFLINTIIQLPWKFELAGIFRAQGGFHYSVSPANGGPDFDGDGLFNGQGLYIDGLGNPLYARNSQTAPPFVNMDLRIAKRFNIGERLKAQILFEMFNLFNRDNPAAVQQLEGGTPPLGSTLQYLPGREGQVGIRFDF
jgi:hypothetical protein